jgi:cation:H+ antiporter
VAAFSGWNVAVDLVLIGVSVGMLVLGAKWLVDGSTDAARLLGIPDRVVGLTVLAVGTSLPELASSVAASWRGQGDLALGNVVGSNLFNSLGILGATVVVAPLEQGGAAFGLDAWVAVGLSLLLVPLLRHGRTLYRWEAGLLLATYLTYLVYIT